MRLALPQRLLSVPLRAKVLTAVAVALVVAVVVGVVALVQLGNLAQRTQDVKAQALVPASQLAEIRRNFLQTRIDALADEVIPGPEGKEHTAFLADVKAVNAAVAVFAANKDLTAEQRTQVDAMSKAWASTTPSSAEPCWTSPGPTA